jgi:hypothetical protein
MLDVHFKDSVDPKGASLATIRGIAICAGVFDGYGKRLTVTSMNDGRHMRGSKHYTGDGWDVRSRGEGPRYAQWPDVLKLQIADTCRNHLGSDYDVVVEGDHFHFEYDPT